MKKPTSSSKKSAPSTQTEKANVAVATEAPTKKTSPTPKTPKQPSATQPKSVPKSKTVTPVAAPVTAKATNQTLNPVSKTTKKPPVTVSKPVVPTSELPYLERVGLTAGSVWHYLSAQGATSVAKLVRELPEEEKVIQRSIGWLAQEDKILIDIIDRVETLSLK